MVDYDSWDGSTLLLHFRKITWLAKYQVGSVVDFHVNLSHFLILYFKTLSILHWTGNVSPGFIHLFRKCNENNLLFSRKITFKDRAINFKTWNWVALQLAYKFSPVIRSAMLTNPSNKVLAVRSQRNIATDTKTIILFYLVLFRRNYSCCRRLQLLV